MKRGLLLAGGALALLAAVHVRAADHQDGPAAKADPTSDITDVFAWMSSDKNRVNLVMNVFPFATTTARFSNTTQYVFHTAAYAAFGTAAAQTEDIICTFDTTQRISCWVGGSFVRGDASSAGGIYSPDGKVRVFAGPRADPFFFNLDGFKDAAADTIASASALSFDGSGCPDLTAKPGGSSKTYQQILFADITGTSHGAAGPVDHFLGANVLSIILSVDKTLLLKGSGPILSFWGSTNH